MKIRRDMMLMEDGTPRPVEEGRGREGLIGILIEKLRARGGRACIRA
jgi:hypothetical protein